MKLFFACLFPVFLFLQGNAQTIDSIKLYSKGMRKEINTLVIKPSNYTYASDSFPVVYLLHGYSGNQSDWIRMVPSITHWADVAQCLVVCADAGNSWYINSPSNTASLYSTFFGEELISQIDSRYRTNPSSAQRAITGLSMGGHGALSLTITYPAVFGAAGSMSGGLDLRPFMKQFDLSKVIADTTIAAFNWKDYSVLQMLDKLTNQDTKLMIDCGIEDFFLQANRDVHQGLLTLKIPHEYIERPGRHTWKYWANAIDYQMMFFKKFFDASR